MKKFIWIWGLYVLISAPLFGAIDTVDGIDWWYEVQNGRATVKSTMASQTTAVDVSTAGEIKIPAKLGGYPVVSIGPNAFRGCSKLTSATVPEGVTNIGSYAFYSCSSLVSVKLPDTVLDIGGDAFRGCSKLKDFEMPSKVSSLGAEVFYACSAITDIVFSRRIESIGVNAFSNCSSLRNASFMAEVGSIGSSAFSNCSSLTNVFFHGIVGSIGSSVFSGCSSLRNASFMAEVGSIGSSAFSNCRSLVEVDFIGNVGSVGSQAFGSCANLGVVDFLGNVSNVLDLAFFRCANLTNVVFHGSLFNVGDYAFGNCAKLPEINLPTSVTNIGEGAFFNCTMLTRFAFPSNVTKLSDSVLSTCTNLMDVVFPPVVESIGGGALMNCSLLADFTLPRGVGSIEKNAFEGTFFWNVQPDNSFILKDGYVLGVKGECPSALTIPEGVTAIAANMFRDYTNLTMVTFPSTLKTIGACAFYNTGLKEVFFPDGLEYIGDYAFASCVNLTRALNAGAVMCGENAFVDSGFPVMSVSFNPNKGTLAAAETNKSYVVGFSYGMLPCPVRNSNGYRFAGWFTEEKGGNLVTESTLVVRDIQVLYAHWQTENPFVYYVPFYKDAATANYVARQTFTNGVAQALRLNTISNPGSTFLGWATEPEGPVVYVDGQVVSNLTTEVGESVPLYACWGENSYDVTGSGHSFGSISFPVSWTGRLDYGVLQTGTKQQVITFTPRVFGTNSVLLVGLEGTSVPQMTLEVRDATAASGWKTVSAISSGGKYEFLKDVEHRLLVTDKNLSSGCRIYEVNLGYKLVPVYFDPNGGELAEASRTRTFCVGKPYATLPTVSKSGVAFAGWYTKASGGALIETSTLVSASITNLFAHWPMDHAYTVAFNADGGTGTLNSVTMTYGRPATLPKNTFSRAGYVFDGWATSAEGDACFADGAMVSNLVATSGGSITLFATWKGVEYSVRFNPDGGLGQPYYQVLEYGRTDCLKENVFGRSGYAFIGWSMSAGGQVADYENRAVVSDLCSIAGGCLDLYAVWRRKDSMQVFSMPSDRSTYEVGNVAWGTNAVLFTGTLSAQMPTNTFVFRPNGQGGRCRIAVDPLVGARIGIAAVFSQGDRTVEVSDLNRDSQMFEFLSDEECRVQIGGISSGGAEYAYQVSVNAKGSHVSFALAGGFFDDLQGHGSNFDFTVGTQLGYLPTPVHANGDEVDFLGWFDGELGPIMLPYLVDEDTEKILVAHWTEPPYDYTIVFDANGGVGETMTNLVVRSNSEFNLPVNQFVRQGYVFQGWMLSLTGTVDYANMAVVSEPLTPLPGGVATLHAKWISDNGIEETVIDDVIWNYKTEAGGVTICNFDGTNWIAAVSDTVKGIVSVPATVHGSPVVALGENAFADCTGITSLDIPSSVADIGKAAFGNCRQLQSVRLPIGLISLEENLFSNCVSLASVDIPWTVTKIGAYAFLNCSNIVTGITIPEYVETIGDYAFMNCTGLKIVRYLCDCPYTGVGIYFGTREDLVSGVLKVRSGWTGEQEVDSEEPSETSADNGIPVADNPDDPNVEPTKRTVTTLPNRWPEEYGRKIVWWVSADLAKVSFGFYNGTGNSEDYYYLANAGRVMEMPDDPEREGYEFLGWYTKPYGGILIEDFSDMEVTSSCMFYAHWRKDGESDPVEYGDVVYNAFTSHEYDGYLLDGDAVVGTIQVKTSKMKLNKATGETNIAIKATVLLLGEGKKVSLKGNGVYEDGVETNLTPTRKTDERTCAVTLTGNDMVGDFDGFSIVGARNVFGEKTDWDMRKARAIDDDCQGTFILVLTASGDSPFANGHVVLSATVGAKGKTKISGSLPDGTRISAYSQLQMCDDGDGSECVAVVPIVLPLYSGKTGGFGCLLRFGENGPAVESLTEWDATPSKISSFTATLEPAGENATGVGTAGNLLSEAEFKLDGEFEFEDVIVDDALSPDGTEVSVSNGKWVVPKAATVKFLRDDEAYEITKNEDNPAQLKLKYTSKTGTFQGSFKVFGITETGKSKKYTATVTGAVIDGAGYGTATIKKVGSVPVMIAE